MNSVLITPATGYLDRRRPGIQAAGRWGQVLAQTSDERKTPGRFSNPP
jgi:hypothetical protein